MTFNDMINKKILELANEGKLLLNKTEDGGKSQEILETYEEIEKRSRGINNGRWDPHQYFRRTSQEYLEELEEMQKNIDVKKTRKDHVLNKKISTTFSRIEKTFTEKSEPIFLNDMGEQISLKKIHKIESVGGKPISMIAVTRHQYDTSNFLKYKNYIKKELKLSRVYYGLWTDGKKVEYDVLYAIPTDDHEQIQNHLNAHNHMNQGIAQVMALIIDSNGKYKVLKNSTYL